MSTSRDNGYWGKKLADDYRNKTGSRRSIRLPASDDIQFEGEKELVTITLQQKAVLANLQTNKAAFEAWSLALRVWSAVEKIDLIWKRPQLEHCKPTEQRHYQRFLYRCKKFESLFPEWFHLLKPELLKDAEALGDGPLCLNVAKDRIQRTNGPSKAEAMLERRLLDSRAFRDRFGLKAENIDHQVPVGLFKGSVAQDNYIFTGGKSAIDIVGIAGDVLWLFELKAGDNIPAGILSELLFYASVMRDAVGPNARFCFEKHRNARGTSVRADDIQLCSRIEAVLLGERLHPLIGHAAVITCLNEAANRNWTASRDSIPVNFHCVTLRKSGAEYLMETM